MTTALRWVAVSLVLWMAAAAAGMAQSQGDVVWVQIEAHPTLAEATERARDYSAGLEDVNGFTLDNGWYGIALGPYRRVDAQTVLNSYQAQGRIPLDAYIAVSADYNAQFWPVGADVLSRGVVVTTLSETAPVQPAATSLLPDETRAQALQSERALSRPEREALQIALQWAGFYRSGIDGAFGRGTRAAMSEWQAFNGFDETGVLTTAQRAELLRQYNAVLEGLGIETVRDRGAGIEMRLPMEALQFDGYDYPFARYTSRSGGAETVLLISQAGDQGTLFGLYEIMQTLEIVPLTGERSRERDRFTLIGENSEIISYTEAALDEGQIKGFTLVWPRGKEEQRTRLLNDMRASFARTEGVLDPGQSSTEGQAIDLVAGLQVRKPKRARSGFFVDSRGTVVTTAEAVESCTRITLDEDTVAQVQRLDAALGIAVLTPEARIAPQAVAAFSGSVPRLTSEIAVAGYSYGGLLGAPTMSFGGLADLRGLSGEADMSRLEVAALEGDAGGPVFDETGGVIGMLLPRASGTRQLPEEVNFAAKAEGIQAVLLAENIAVQSRTESARMAPEDITAQARAMTVLVSCWD